MSEAVRHGLFCCLQSVGNGRADEVKKRKLPRDILYLNVVVSYVAFEPRRQRLGLFRIRVEEECAPFFCHDKNVPTQFSFRVENRRLKLRRCGCLSQVVRDLSVEVTKTVRAFDAQTDTARQIEKGRSH